MPGDGILQVLAEQRVILSELVESNRNVLRALKSLQDSRKSSQVSYQLPEDLVLPLKSVDEVLHLEERLADETVRQSLVYELSQLFLQ